MMMPNRTLKTMFVINGVFVFASSLLGPLFAIYMEGFKGGILPVSMVWAIYLFATALFTYFLAKKGDGYKHKRHLLAGGYLVRALCWFAFIFANNILEIAVIQFFVGVGEALGTPAFNAMFAEHLDKNKHIMDYADWEILADAILVIGTILGGFVAAQFGFKALFGIMSLLALVSLFLDLAHPELDSAKTTLPDQSENV